MRGQSGPVSSEQRRGEGRRERAPCPSQSRGGQGRGQEGEAGPHEPDLQGPGLMTFW